MTFRNVLTGGSIVFTLLWAVLLPTRLVDPVTVTFQSDAREYSLGAVHLLQDGMYSLDGITSTAEREPGYSFFLASVYGIFGIENRIAVYFMQGLLYLIAIPGQKNSLCHWCPFLLWSLHLS